MKNAGKRLSKAKQLILPSNVSKVSFFAEIFRLKFNKAKVKILQGSIDKQNDFFFTAACSRN